MSRKRSLKKSFSFAFDGIKQALQNEPNFRIHIFLAILTVALAYYLNFSINEWLILMFTIAFVIVAELINTAIESLVDIVSPDIRKEAKLAKDVLAASVLIAAILAIVIGMILFLPKLI
jgi:diacylglycerol kinase